MSLYSSDTLSSVGEDNQAEANHGSVSEREILSVYDNESPLVLPFHSLFQNGTSGTKTARKVSDLYT